jgi:hypothetical protein
MMDIHRYSTTVPSPHAQTPIRGTIVGNSACVEQPSIIPHLARAYLDKRIDVSKTRFNVQTMVSLPKNKNYHPDTLLRKLADSKKKPEHLLTMAATGNSFTELEQTGLLKNLRR